MNNDGNFFMSLKKEESLIFGSFFSGFYFMQFSQ